MKKIILFALTGLFISNLFAQRKVESSAEILHEMQKLKVVGNVLYLAAHPDDENTRLIAWLENEKKLRTAYLSLTRGDGGQNLIGTEKGDALGILRTQELLEARNEDGGEQFFTRAKDFGYSKTPKETFEKWNKEKVLEDVVWVIRKFQPDVIVTRFPSDGRGGHGHHTASAILAEEAFELAADKSYAPQQLKYVNTWQPKRLLWNTSVWWDQQLPEKAAKEEDYIKIDIGAYNSVLGLSYSEIASDARSQHKSQGFGSARARGTKIEYLKHTKGDQAKEDLFEGIDLSWNRLKGGAQIEQKIDQMISNFNPLEPSKSIDGLMDLYSSINAVETNKFKDQKLKDVKHLILACAGIYAEALADDFIVAKETVDIDFRIVKRSDIEGSIESVKGLGSELKIDTVLPYNSELSYKLTADQKYFNGVDHPYWLAENYDEINFFMPQHAGSPENPKRSISYTLTINGNELTFDEEIDYKWTDRAKGELHRDVIQAPVLTISSIEESILFTSKEPRTIGLIAESHKSNISGSIKIILPKNWKAEPSTLSYNLTEKGQQKKLEFTLFPPAESSIGEIKFKENEKELRAIQRIEHDHIKPQISFPFSAIKVTKLELKGTDKKIAYVEGSGDLVDESLRQLGYSIDNYSASEVLTADLSNYNTILVGIRAYNTEDNIKSVNQVLNDFAKNGGTVIVQYNTSRGLKSNEIGPYQLELSRNRVTDEFATPTLLNEKHPIFQSPNKITAEDFNNWVQERGLYFAGTWGSEYKELIAWSDEGEEMHKGSLLVADHGKGKFIYTGISFFRQLPAGVPGAYRLLANLIAYGQTE